MNVQSDDEWENHSFSDVEGMYVPIPQIDDDWEAMYFDEFHNDEFPPRQPTAHEDDIVVRPLFQSSKSVFISVYHFQDDENDAYTSPLLTIEVPKGKETAANTEAEYQVRFSKKKNQKFNIAL